MDTPRTPVKALIALGTVIVLVVVALMWLPPTPTDAPPRAPSPESVPGQTPPATTSPPAPTEPIEVPPSIPSARSPYEVDLQQLLNAVTARHPLEALDPTWVVEVPPGTFAKRHAEWLNRHAPAHRLGAEETAFKAMGLLPHTFDYQEGVTRLMQEGTVYFFDETTPAVYRLSPLPTGADAPFPLRELVYLLQHRHFAASDALRRASTGPLGNDESHALMAALQGHAFAVFVDAQLGAGAFAGVDGLEILAQAEASLHESAALAHMPEFVRRLALFPEVEGARFVRHRVYQNEHTDLSTLFAALPRSTQEILHPERDATSDPPLQVTTVLPRKALGIDEIQASYDGVLGEFGIRSWLELVGTNPNGAAVASGWDGDRLWCFPMGKRSLLVHVSVWDDDNAAEAFEGATKALFSQRYGPDARRRSAVMRQGRTVAWLEGTLPPDGKAPGALRATLESTQTSMP